MPCGVHTDRAQLEQVLVNLVLNARDAMPMGGTLTIGTGSLFLTEDDARSLVDLSAGPYVQLSISDTGCGMDSETQGQIFEPFFTTKDPGKGIGLGLSTAYGIIQQSNGSIRVESEIDQGATFTIYLPEVIATIEETATPEQDDVPATDAADILSGSETILVVEDDDELRRLVHVILDTAGYTVLEAANGQEALRICEGHHGPIHLLIADVVMPQMSGTDLAGHFIHARPEAKVLYISGYTGDHLQQYEQLTNDVPLLEKPFDSDELIHTVREILDRKF
jgi:CheY-like chemotaxis protein